MVSSIPRTIISHFLDNSTKITSNIHYFSFNNGIQIGDKIILDGHMNPAASKFELNLHAGTVVSKELIKYGDILLHVSIHPSGGYALTNSRLNRGVWGREERTQRGRLPRPLLQNQRFRITIRIDDPCYHVEVNERPFMTFPHRAPLYHVGLLSYDGDANIENVQVIKATPISLPMPALVASPQNVSSSPSMDHVLYQVSYPKLPLLQPIKCGLQPGMVITIKANVRDNRFDMSFYQGTDPYDDPNSDVAFHLEVYIREMDMIRNSHQGGNWQREEKHLEQLFPFRANMSFEMTIRVESNRFMVSVNNFHLFDFYHRVLPLSTIDHLGIHGGLEITSICITESPL